MAENADKTQSTIFDDVFRTMEEKMPQLMIPVINEVFATAYSENEKVEHFQNEHQTKEGKIITDSCFGIRNHLYHVECQSNVDYAMTVRMIEYDFSIALHGVKKKKRGIYEMEFPRSCVLYLRHNPNTPDVLKMKVRLPNRKRFVYCTPIIKVQNYTKDEIFQKNLLLFLPFYIMRYEKQLKEMKGDTYKNQAVISEYKDIRNRLNEKLGGADKSVFYSDMVALIVKISDYVLRRDAELKRGIGDVMGGKILELPSDRLLAEGESRLGKLINILLNEGRMDDIRLVATNEEARKEFYKKYGIID